MEVLKMDKNTLLRVHDVICDGGSTARIVLEHGTDIFADEATVRGRGVRRGTLLCASDDGTDWKVASRGSVRKYSVVGRWPFPLDMLRYDGSYPASEEDARSIAEMSGPACPGPDSPRRRVIQLEIHLGEPGARLWPCQPRWQSFGWELVGAQTVYDVKLEAVRTVRVFAEDGGEAAQSAREMADAGDAAAAVSEVRVVSATPVDVDPDDPDGEEHPPRMTAEEVSRALSLAVEGASLSPDRVAQAILLLPRAQMAALMDAAHVALMRSVSVAPAEPEMEQKR